MGEQFGILLTYAGAVILIFIVGKIFFMAAQAGAEAGTQQHRRRPHYLDF